MQVLALDDAALDVRHQHLLGMRDELLAMGYIGPRHAIREARVQSGSPLTPHGSWWHAVMYVRSCKMNVLPKSPEANQTRNRKRTIALPLLAMRSAAGRRVVFRVADHHREHGTVLHDERHEGVQGNATPNGDDASEET